MIDSPFLGHLSLHLQGSRVQSLFYFLGSGISARGNDQSDGPGHHRPSHRKSDHIRHSLRIRSRPAYHSHMAARQGGQQAQLAASRPRSHQPDQQNERCTHEQRA